MEHSTAMFHLTYPIPELVSGRSGGPDQIRLSDLSIFNPPPKGHLMAVVIKGYVDDSRAGDSHLWALGGFVGFVDQWEDFERDWSLLLDTHEIPHLHMREFADPKGVYAKWWPAKEHYAELAALFQDVVKVIGRSKIEGFGGMTRCADLKRFNDENGTALEPYPLAAYGSLIGLWKRHEREPIEVLFDHVEQVGSQLISAKKLADSDRYYAGDFDNIQMIPLNRAWSAKKILPLQAADFLAWEWRKLHEDRKAWWDKENKYDDLDARWVDFEAWMEREKPRTRKSLQALVERTTFHGLIWNRDSLREAHEKRGGQWA
jgi:hypothetical protein